MRIGAYVETDAHTGRIEEPELAGWIRKNIHLPKPVKEELKHARDKLRARLKKPIIREQGKVKASQSR
jgi:hypothetical protein